MTNKSLIQIVEEYGEAMYEHGRLRDGEAYDEACAILSEIRQRIAAAPVVSQPLTTEAERTEASAQCWCSTCRPVNPMVDADNRMVVCPDCGNKRCPRASDHIYRCSGSNEPGQVGVIAARPEGE